MISSKHGVTLHPVNRPDLAQLRAWRNSYEVWRWTRQNDLLCDADQEDWFDRQRLDPSIKMYLIRDKEAAKAVGVCGLTSIDPWNRRAEFSLYVAPEHWGNQYGKQALSTLLDHGFRTLGLNLIWGESFDGNPAIEMFKGLGFTGEGARRDFYFREGKFLDAQLFSIRAAEWLHRVPAGTKPAKEPQAG